MGMTIVYGKQIWECVLYNCMGFLNNLCAFSQSNYLFTKHYESLKFHLRLILKFCFGFLFNFIYLHAKIFFIKLWWSYQLLILHIYIHFWNIVLHTWCSINIYIMLISNYGCLINCCMYAYILDELMKSSSNHRDE